MTTIVIKKIKKILICSNNYKYNYFQIMFEIKINIIYFKIKNNRWQESEISNLVLTHFKNKTRNSPVDIYRKVHFMKLLIWRVNSI